MPIGWHKAPCLPGREMAMEALLLVGMSPSWTVAVGENLPAQSQRKTPCSHTCITEFHSEGGILLCTSTWLDACFAQALVSMHVIAVHTYLTHAARIQHTHIEKWIHGRGSGFERGCQPMAQTNLPSQLESLHLLRAWLAP